MMPMIINVVDGERFSELLNYVEPGYSIASKCTITGHIKKMNNTGKPRAQLLLADKLVSKRELHYSHLMMYIPIRELKPACESFELSA